VLLCKRYTENNVQLYQNNSCLLLYFWIIIWYVEVIGLFYRVIKKGKVIDHKELITIKTI
jgi:hypothetical protein